MIRFEVSAGALCGLLVFLKVGLGQRPFVELTGGCCDDGGADKGGGLWEGGGGLTTLIEGNLAAFDFCSASAGLLEAVAVTGAGGLMPDNVVGAGGFLDRSDSVVDAGGFLESTWVGFLEAFPASIS